MNNSRPYRLGILLSHPVQYYAPWFRDLANRLDLEVFYAHAQDAKGQSAAGFGVEFQWDTPLLEGYRYRWLKNVSKKPALSSFHGCDTPELLDLITPDRFDGFLVFGWNRKSSWQAMRTCWKRNVPLLMRGDSQLPMVKSRWKTLLKAGPYRWFLPKIDMHLYVGERNREYLEHYGVTSQHLTFCPHFVDNAYFAARAHEARASGAAAALRKEFGIPNDAFVALFVGKLIAKKNPQHFVKAVQRITSEELPIHALIVGSGPLEAECRNLADASQRIHFAGFRNQSQLPAFYAAANALVLTSDGTETWGLVVNEAMSCDTPCVVSNTCGCSPDMIVEGQTGFTYPEGEIDALSSMLAKMTRLSASFKAEMQQAMQEKCRRYSITTASESLLGALEVLTGRSSRVPQTTEAF